MRHIGCLVLLAAWVAGTARRAGEGVFPYEHHEETLANGLKIICTPMQTPGLAAYWSIVRTGSRDEVERGKSGFAHFFEHMMFRGTKRYPGPVYDRIVTGLGADANAYTTDDYTAYHLQFAAEDLEKVVEIEADRFQNLDYGEEVFQTEAGAIYGEYRKGATDPFFFLDEKLRDTAYDVHTYKHTTMGFEADIRAMPQAYDYSRAFFERFYRPDNVVLLVVGDVQPQRAFDLVRRYYGDWKPGYQKPAVREEPPQQGERRAEVEYPGQTQPILNLAYKGEALDPANRHFVAALLLEDLAFGPTSELYRKLVLKEQKVEFIAASFPLNRDRPLFEVFAMIRRAEDIDYVRGEIERTLAEFQTGTVEPARLDAVRRHNKYAFLMGLDAPSRVAGALARFVAVSGGIEVVDQLYTEMARVTPADLREATRRYFTPERRTVVVLKGAQP